MKRIPILLFLLLISAIGFAQNNVFMTEANNGQHFGMSMDVEAYYLNIFSENDGSGLYPDDTPSHRWIIVDSGTCEGEDRCMSLYFNTFDIPEGDTLLIHDGPSLS